MASDAVIKTLTSATPLLETVQPDLWSWYYLPLEFDGGNTTYNAVVTVDAETSFQDLTGEEVWVKFDVMMVNGTAPGNQFDAGPITSGVPYCWDPTDECPNGFSLRFVAADRVTASFGFNASAPGGMMEPAFSQLVVGVREASGVSNNVQFTITASHLPRVLTDGAVIESAVPPCTDDASLPTCMQYFTVPVSDYDVLELSLIRTGDNLTTTDPSGDVVSNDGRGLVGDLYVGGPSTLHTPPPAAYEKRRVITNNTASVEILDYFCTTAQQAGTYTVAIVGGSRADGGFGDELFTTQQEMTLNAGIGRMGRGRFRLVVRHAAFRAGLLEGDADGADVRPGCVGFGQTRNYTIEATSMHDANLYAELTGGNVTALRARCAGCDWVEATPPLAALAASPCSMRNGTTWEVQVAMADAVPATLAGLRPTEFILSTQRQNATVEPGDRILPRALGGRGYACCGAIQSFIVPDVPRTHALAIQLNVTSGHLRSAYVKHGSCARPRVDVRNGVCDGACVVKWLTVYDEFYGRMQFSSSLYLDVPFGDEGWTYDAAKTKRRPGDWYVSVESLPGIAAEYQMDVRLLPPPRAPEVFKCSRFAGFCPREHYHTGPAYSVELTSGAPGAHPAGAAMWMLGLSAAVALALNTLGLWAGGGPRQSRAGGRASGYKGAGG